jgi:hypothetical protein
MNMYGEIAIIDVAHASGWNDTQGMAVCAALQHQISYDVQHSYRASSTAVNWHGGGAVPGGAWPIYILTDPDTAGALGYHDLDPLGTPYGRVFTKPTKAAGVSLSSVLSHETIEAFIDPWANLWADGLGGESVAFEACDPVEASSYTVFGVEVSNFVTRAWFDVNDKVGPFDHLHHLSKPRTLEKGGYEIIMSDGTVTQRFADVPPDVWRQELKHTPQPSRTEWREVRVYFEA